MRILAVILGLLLAMPALAQSPGTLSLPSGANLSAVQLQNAINAVLVAKQDCCSIGGGGGGGGAPTLNVSGITVNGTLGSLPANGFLGPFLLIEETAGHAATVAIGTTSGASDVLGAQSVPPSGTITVDITAFSKGWFSASSPQTLFLTTSGGGSSISAQLFYWVLGTSGGGGGGGSGTVTSVGLSTPGSTLTLGGPNPVTAAGTINVDINYTHAGTWTGQQTLTNAVMTGSTFTATGLVKNADLVNASTTVNGVPCNLGSSCAIVASAGSIAIGNPIVGGTSGRIEYNNAGNLGEMPITGSGNVVLSTSPTLVSPALGTPSAVNLTNATAVPAAQLSGIVPAANGGAGAITGSLKGNGSGVVSQAACADLSNGTTACSTAIGTSGATIPLFNGNNAWGAGQAVTPVVLTPGATVTPNAALSNNFTLAPTTNFTLANPTNLKAGQTLNFWITQDGTGSRIITWGSQYQASGGSSTLVLSTTAAAKDMVSCQADTTTTLTCSLQTVVFH